MRSIESRIRRLETAQDDEPPFFIVMDYGEPINQDDVDAIIADRRASGTTLRVIDPTENPDKERLLALKNANPPKLKSEEQM